MRGQASLAGVAAAMVRRDLTVALRHPAALANPVLFFVVAVCMFPFGVGPEPQTLATIAPGVIWVAALLATLLAVDTMFREDLADGTLEQMLLSACPTTVLVLAKVLAHWLLVGLPLIVVAPLLAVLMQLPSASLGTLVASLALGTPLLGLIGGIGAALTLAARGAGLLLTLIVLPLYVPVLIFGAGAVQATAAGLPATSELAFLAAMLALALALAPLAIAGALRASVD